MRGFELPPITADVSRAARSKVLDEILGNGISAGLGRLAGVWESAAPTLDRQFGQAAPVALRQIPECVGAQGALMYAKTIAFFLCTPPMVLEPAGPALCASMGATIVGLEWYLYSRGC